MLYRAASHDFNMTVKAMAASQGADVSWDDDWYDPAPPPKPEVIEAGDIRFIPIGLGYEG